MNVKKRCELYTLSTYGYFKSFVFMSDKSSQDFRLLWSFLEQSCDCEFFFFFGACESELVVACIRLTQCVCLPDPQDFRKHLPGHLDLSNTRSFEQKDLENLIKKVGLRLSWAVNLLRSS